ncbi:MAG: protein kinase domain-containing protein, partial [Planctomycetota bacterium]
MNSDEFDELVEKFLEQCRRGKNPSISHYAEMHPPLADQIRAMFPVYLLLEEVGSLPDGAPEQVDDYRIVRELGRGGMGVVYEAKREGERFAIKVLPPHLLATEDYVRRFIREAQIGRKLQHDNVVRTIDVGTFEAQGHPQHYLVMEYVEGQTLHSLLEEMGRVPEELCWHIAREIAQGLQAIHEAGAVHRDLKPANVLITSDQVVKLMDLGAAQVEDASIRLSRTGTFIGTMLYASPEQLIGEDVDARADLYALGLMLYELATGEHPSSAKHAATIMHRRMLEDPKPPSELNPQISALFEEMIKTLLARSQDERYASAAALLEVLAQGEQSSWWIARAEEIRARTKRPLRRIRIPRETAVHGREDSLARLRAVYDKTKAGDGQVVLIQGEAGIGKTRLIDEFVGALERQGEDLNFLFGSYPPGGAATAEGAFSTAYREQLGSESLDSTLRKYLGDLPTLVPAFSALLRRESPPPEAQPLTKQSLEAAFVHVTHALAAERPTIVMIDDLHFAPKGGRSLFAALAQAVPGKRILLIGTSRPDLPEHWTVQMDRLEQVARLALSRLGPKDLANLLTEVFGSEHLARELSFEVGKKSDGNPLFVLELLRSLREAGVVAQRAEGDWTKAARIEDLEVPSSIMDLVHGRLLGLAEEEREILDVASCCGFEFDGSLVARALRAGEIPILRRLARMEKAHRLVRSAGRRFIFDHHLLREAVYEGLPAPLRERYHEAIAEAIEEAEKAKAEPSGAASVALCEHFLRGVDPRRASPYMSPALRHLGYQSDSVAELASRALELPGVLEGVDRARVLLRQANALDLLGRLPEQRQVLDEAKSLAGGVGDDGLLNSARQQLVWHLIQRDECEEAVASSREELEEARKLCQLGRYAEARDHAEHSAEFSRRHGDTFKEGLSCERLGQVMAAIGHSEQALELFDRAVSVSLEHSDKRGNGIARARTGWVWMDLGEHARARECMEEAMECFRAVVYREAEAWAYLGLGRIEGQ